jgi:hypothetical protein
MLKKESTRLNEKNTSLMKYSHSVRSDGVVDSFIYQLLPVSHKKQGILRSTS